MADKRRRQYVPLSVYFAQGKTGTRLLERFGRDGLLVWVLYLTACKANWVQGQLTYVSEAEGWMKLGLVGYEPAFTLEEFFRFTGTLKQTRTTRSGHVKDVVCTQWIQWNYDVKTQLEAERKARKRAENAADETPDKEALEVEVDVDVDDEVETRVREAAASGPALARREGPRIPYSAPKRAAVPGVNGPASDTEAYVRGLVNNGVITEAFELNDFELDDHVRDELQARLH